MYRLHRYYSSLVGDFNLLIEAKTTVANCISSDNDIKLEKNQSSYSMLDAIYKL